MLTRPFRGFSLFGALDASVEEKSAPIPFTDEPTADYGWYEPTTFVRWGRKDWLDTSWSSLVTDLFSVNSALGACVLKYALGYPEPPVMVRINDEEQPRHPLQALLDRPNPQMSHAELKVFSIIYRIVGGNCYLVKTRNEMGQVIELWPFHAGQMWPVPGRFTWVEEYEYDAGRGQKQRIPAKDVIHLKWPIPDLSKPWLGMSPLVLIAREVMSDTEASEFAYALLHNDAVPHGVITLPPGTPMSPQNAEKLRNKFKDQHGGDERGGVVILEQGADYARVSLSPNEMDLSALRRVPEARIAGNLGMSPMVGHLTAGLERATYSNAEQAERAVTQGTFVPMWRSDGLELTHGLQGEFPGNPVVAYNTSLVAALQESTNEKYKRSLDAFEKNVATLDEARALIDLPPFDQVVQGDTRGTLLSFELSQASSAAPPLPPKAIDALVTPAQLTQEDA